MAADPANALHHSSRLVEFERSPGLFHEPALQCWGPQYPFIVDALNAIYVYVWVATVLTGNHFLLDGMVGVTIVIVVLAFVCHWRRPAGGQMNHLGMAQERLAC